MNRSTVRMFLALVVGLSLMLTGCLATVGQKAGGVIEGGADAVKASQLVKERAVCDPNASVTWDVKFQDDQVAMCARAKLCAQVNAERQARGDELIPAWPVGAENLPASLGCSDGGATGGEADTGGGSPSVDVSRVGYLLLDPGHPVSASSRVMRGWCPIIGVAQPDRNAHVRL